MNFYKSAALALDHLDKYQGSVKGSLAAAGVTGSSGETRRVLALVIETLKYRNALTSLLVTVPLLSLEKLTFPKRTPPRTPSSRSLLLVLLHDLLFSSKLRIEASDKWPPKPSVMRHQARLRAELVRLQIKEGKSRKEDLGKRAEGEESARYVRWNPNVNFQGQKHEDWSLEALFQHLKQLGYTKSEEAVYPVPAKSFFMDPHLQDCLLVFSPSSNWWVGDKWYQGGAIILQDKASCFPAKVLMEDWVDGEGECLDATAAPGNKTSYISALMGNSGTLHAFERSAVRYKTLEKMLSTAKCSNVTAQRADFTDSNPSGKEYSNVTRILLDPSCSGSGIVNRLDYLVEEADVEESDVQADRLDKLAAFQLQMILHAFKFASAKRIVYSTCSIYAQEDEQVVYNALQSNLAKDGKWILADKQQVLPGWERRGRAEVMDGDQELADSVIRCLPGVDRTNGFFVACFVRGERKPKAQTTELASTVSKKDSKSKKRTRDVVETEVDVPELQKADVAEDVEMEVEEPKEDKAIKPKTEAQLERARRKKQQQKKRKIAE